MNKFINIIFYKMFYRNFNSICNTNLNYPNLTLPNLD